MEEIASILHGAGIENGQQEARWLIQAALGDEPYPPTGYFEDDFHAKVSALVDRRVGGEPLQYVTGIAGFRRLELAVGAGVLVPRPETETLVEHALARLPEGGTLVDIGTGAGPIALAVADERPDARVLATEVAPEAVEWAERNKAKLSSTVEILQGDLFDPLPEELRGNVDVVASNPPYIANRERSVLPVDVIEHEPHVALFAGPDGTAVIERLATAAGEWLAPTGWLLIEISPHLQTAVPDHLRRLGYRDISVHPDLARRPRVVEALRP